MIFDAYILLLLYATFFMLLLPCFSLQQKDGSFDDWNSDGNYFCNCETSKAHTATHTLSVRMCVYMCPFGEICNFVLGVLFH